MKKLILFAIITSTFSVFNPLKAKTKTPIAVENNTRKEYAEGWKKGYCEGWKDVKGKHAICPATPHTPVPEMGKKSYQDGYNRGFKAGIKAAKR